MNSQPTPFSCQTTFGCRGSIDGVGVLLVQLGTPDAPTTGALRRYLKQFLSDPRVIEINKWLWWPILYGIILNTRPRRSAAAYARIWTPEGSPLMVISRKQQQGIADRLAARGLRVPVALGMRYGNPSIESAIAELEAQNCRRIIVLPLYPQYAAATTASVCDDLFAALMRRRWMPSVRIIDPFYNEPEYRSLLASSLQRYLSTTDKQPEKILVSYHGVPQRYVKNGDPYCCMCTETTAALRTAVGLSPDFMFQTFQSRFGPEAWLQPYTDETVEQLGHQGVKHIAVVSPAFTTDCLETIDELGNELQEEFEEAGGERVDRIPCLNDDPAFLDFLTALVAKHGHSWLDSSAPRSLACERCPSQLDREEGANG